MDISNTPDEVYDFIVVGGGNAGAVVASRLAWSPARPSVLLLEAGGLNEGLENKSGAERYEVAFHEESTVNWKYKTAPQYGQAIDYSRGKGLGGSTAINFCGWLVGAKGDFDEWARRVGDDAFAFENAKRCLKRIEGLHNDVPVGFRRYIDPKDEDHGQSGPVHLSYQKEWHRSVQTVLEAGQQRGYNINSDVNDGDPIGLGVGPTCIYDGVRVTSASAYLRNNPPNLRISADSHVAKVIIQGKSAIGVATTDGKRYMARSEVIISGGAINSPQLLLLSGIGPSSQLREHGIEVLRHLPQVGQNLQDHCFSTAGIVIRSEGNKPESKQGPSPTGWFKIDNVLQSQEFQGLPQDMQEYLRKPTVSTWEMATHTPFLDDAALPEDEDVFAATALIMNPQSKGIVSLISTDPLEAPHIDPKFLTHPFDKRVAIEAMRELLGFLSAPALREKTLRAVGWPSETTDAAILKHFQSTLRSSWHMCGTVRMGSDAESSCVDSDFRVHGVDRLRVVDMSVVPLIPNTHTQSTAYILAEIAADKLIASYSLDQKSAARL